MAAAVVLLGLINTPVALAAPEGIHKIQHVVVIMQENRSFDSYFGTYPGANGIPAGVCVPDPLHGGCVVPFHDGSNVNHGGPHSAANAAADIDNDKMDGFVGVAEKVGKCTSTNPTCNQCPQDSSNSECIDVMGYHDAREIPNYWTYAQNYALQDNMFESDLSWSLPEHLFQVSAWSAICPNGDSNPFDCTNAREIPYSQRPEVNPDTTYAWTDITYLLHNAGVSWRYYVFKGNEPDCEDDEAITCAPVTQGPTTPGIWNPLVDFTDVKQDGQLENIQSLTNFYTVVHEQRSCGLPSVSWITPNEKVSEHPPALISRGQAYVTTLINAIMRSPCWGSTAIFLSWDDWGGFYDHVVPPSIDHNGYGLRVPGLVISPYAKAGYIDHQQLSHDAYLKFIENDFLGGQGLNPATDGRPDPRPDVREYASGLGNLETDFNFNQVPRSPLILPTDPAPGPASCPPDSALPGQPPLGPCVPPSTPSSPPPTNPSSSPPAPTPILQLTASVAPRQDMRLHRGRIYFFVSCNEMCSIYAYGHLNLIRHRRHIGLRSVKTKLIADHSERITVSLTHRDLSVVHYALLRRRSVKAAIEIEASGAAGRHQTYRVEVTLSWR